MFWGPRMILHALWKNNYCNYWVQKKWQIWGMPLFSNNPHRRSEVFLLQTINLDFKAWCNSFQQISLKDHPYFIHNMASKAHLETSKKTRSLLMWPWPVRIVRGWRHTGWSWHQQVLCFRGCSGGTNTLIHWSIWEGWYFMTWQGPDCKPLDLGISKHLQHVPYSGWEHIQDLRVVWYWSGLKYCPHPLQQFISLRGST